LGEKIDRTHGIECSRNRDEGDKEKTHQPKQSTGQLETALVELEDMREAMDLLSIFSTAKKSSL
jgi:hypothetical protein